MSYLPFQRFPHEKQRVYSFFHLPKMRGLRAHMMFSFVWVTLVVTLIVVCLYAVLLAGHLSFARSQGIPLAQVEDYPWMAAILLGLLILLLVPLLGGFFGTLTTRTLVRRVQVLVAATSQMTVGSYDQRVYVSGDDELGQLEWQFTTMAQQLAESIKAREELAKHHARFAERDRISRELHDAVAQDLFSVRMLVDGLHETLSTDSPFQAQFALLAQTTTHMSHEMRALLLEMRPVQLEPFGLAAALEELVARYRSRLDIVIKTTITAVTLDPLVEHTLLRIAGEALSNSIRHAHATTIALSLVPLADSISLSVIDNGSGMASWEQETRHGLGLCLMQERVQALGGIFEVQTSPGQGTGITVCLPLQERDHDSCRDCG